MLHDIEMHILTEYDSIPSHCKVIINNEIVFNDIIDKKLILKEHKN